MRRILLVCVVAGLGATGAWAATSASRTSFATGSWSGTSRYSQTIEGISVVASSTFTMRVSGGRVTGTLISQGTASGSNNGQRVTIQLTGRYPVSGSASGPVARGLLKFSGKAQGKAQTGSGAVINTFTGLHGTCDRMTGRIVLRGADEQPSTGGPNSVSAPFTATRRAGSGPGC